MPTNLAKISRQFNDLNHNAAENRPYTNYNVDPNQTRPPEYHVYIFSVSERDFDISRSGLNISRLTLRGNGAAQDARIHKNTVNLAMKLVHPYPLTYTEQTNGDIRWSYVWGEKVAMDILNPNQKTISMDAYIAPESIIGLGDDLISAGLFYATEKECQFADDDLLHERPMPPTHLVNAAIKRKEARYNAILEKAASFEHSNQIKLNEYLEREPDAHIACEYFNLVTSWHKKFVRAEEPVACSYCSLPISPTAAYHFLPTGKPCVNDWRRAVESGAFDRREVPISKRWWTPEPKPQTVPQPVADPLDDLDIPDPKADPEFAATGNNTGDDLL